MPSAKRKKSEKRKHPALTRVETVDTTSLARERFLGEPAEEDYARFLIALRDSPPGALLFIQFNSPVQRRELPERLKADGLQRSFAVADFSAFFLGPPPYGVLREFLEDLPPPLPEILFVDGLEHWVDADPDTIQALNLGRERLAALGAVVVFLLPAYVIDLIRTHALNLWSWRAHYYVLDSAELSTNPEATLLSVGTGSPITPGDTVEARHRRIRILRRLLAQGLAENRTRDSLLSVILPLTRELYDAGLFGEALKVIDLTNKESQGIEHQQEKAVALNLQAAILWALGNLPEAEQFLQQSLAIREKTLGVNRPETWTVLNNLAVLYRSQGKYPEAEALLRRALTSRETLLGAHHPDVASSLNNLADFYRAQARFREAETLFRRSLSIRENALGSDHPDVAQSLNNLALLYDDQGQYAVAQKLYERSLDIAEKSLGGEHPAMATALSNLAHVLSSQGKYAEAEPLYLRSLAIQEKIFGPRHGNTAIILSNLASLYHKQGNDIQAETLFKKALSILERVEGKDPSFLATVLNNLSALYYAQGRYAEAEPPLRKSVGIFERIFGRMHPKIASTLSNHAALLYKLGQKVEATMLEARARAIRAKHAQEPSP